MVTERLKNIFAFSIPLFVAHGLEEILTGFYNIDTQVGFWFGGLAKLPSMQSLFLLFQIMIGLMLVFWYILLLGPKWQLRLMLLPGTIFVYELHHLYKTFYAGGYYPGIITAIPLYIVGFFFWRELIQNWKKVRF